MATFIQQKGKSIDEKFKEFHEKNPKVYQLFKMQVQKALQRGKKKMSSKTILGFIRWEIYLQTHSNDEFKINDAYTSRYARLFIEDHPQYENIFNLRKLRS